MALALCAARILSRVRNICLLGAVLALPACAETSFVSQMAKGVPIDLGPEVAALGNLAHPHRGGRYKVGLPYTIKGITYRPEVDYSYNKVGIASWYGPGFDGKLTANGEVYDQDLLTAAHKTLPMPSLARVTNLENGRSVVVRVNDRGPFAPGRIIDMSERGAKLLGFHKNGITKVRVQILAEESKILAAAAKGEPVPRYAGMQPHKLALLPAPPVPNRKPRLMMAPTVPEVQLATAVLRNEPPAIEIPRFGDSSNAGGLYIQLAAFQNPDNADRARRSVSHLGPAAVYRADVSGDTFYRLRLGPFVDPNDADRLLAQVVQAGYPGARITAD